MYKRVGDQGLMLTLDTNGKRLGALGKGLIEFLKNQPSIEKGGPTLSEHIMALAMTLVLTERAIYNSEIGDNHSCHRCDMTRLTLLLKNAQESCLNKGEKLTDCGLKSTVQEILMN